MGSELIYSDEDKKVIFEEGYGKKYIWSLITRWISNIMFVASGLIAVGLVIFVGDAAFEAETGATELQIMHADWLFLALFICMALWGVIGAVASWLEDIVLNFVVDYNDRVEEEMYRLKLEEEAAMEERRARFSQGVKVG